MAVATMLLETQMHICVPTQGAEDWKRLLAKESHWKEGHSAMALAQCWETYRSRGAPPEVEKALLPVSFYLAIPEFKVGLPPRGGRPSFSGVSKASSHAAARSEEQRRKPLRLLPTAWAWSKARATCSSLARGSPRP